MTRVLKHVRSRVDTIVYKYTVHSNKFSQTEGQPSSLDFKYDLSPISIVVQQSRMPAYRFVTSTCAIIGGVFTMIGARRTTTRAAAAAAAPLLLVLRADARLRPRAWPCAHATLSPAGLFENIIHHASERMLKKQI